MSYTRTKYRPKSGRSPNATRAISRKPQVARELKDLRTKVRLRGKVLKQASPRRQK